MNKKTLKMNKDWKLKLYEIYALEENGDDDIMYDLSAEQMIAESPTGTLKGVSL